MAGPIPPFKRLLSGYTLCPDTGCWLWTGHKYRNGYGAIKVFGRMRLAHRFSYELHKGPIPEGLCILHSCDVRNCVNPEHLRVGTHQENMQEASERGRMRSGDQHPMFGRRHKPGIKNRLSKPVRVLGKIYSSQKEAERALGLGGGTVRFWILNKPQAAQRITREEYRKHAKSM